MILLHSAKTDVGMLRTENQDAFGICQEGDFFFVCDGMGGGVCGDFASRYATEVMEALFPKITKEESLAVLGGKFSSFDEKIIRPIALIKIANRALNNLTGKYPKLLGMGTTCSAVWFERDRALVHIYNVGDSRVYRIRNGSIKQLTEDHSKIKELIDNGKMTEEEAKTAEIQSMITRALGIAPSLKVDYKSEIVKSGDIYVLCTDGLNGELDDFVINDIVNLHKPDVTSISNELITAANNAAGRDNTTVISLYVQDEYDCAPVDPDSVQKEIIVFDEEKQEESSKEDAIIHKFEKDFKTQIPKLAKQKNLFSNPLFIALIIVILCVFGIFLFSFFSHKEQKSMIELTGNVSGVKLDVRTLSKEKLDEIKNTEEKVFKMQILQECIANKDVYSVPMSNVTVTISNDGQNKFMGLSGYVPLDIKLPKGKYSMTLNYPSYKILDDKFQLRSSMDIYLENSGSLFNILVIMVPEEDLGDIK